MISNGFILIINNKSVIIKERRAISICTQHGNSKFEKAKHEKFGKAVGRGDREWPSDRGDGVDVRLWALWGRLGCFGPASSMVLKDPKGSEFSCEAKQMMTLKEWWT